MGILTLPATTLIVLLAAPAFPWVVKRILGAKSGVWFGIAEVILIGAFLAFLYSGIVEAKALCDAPVRIEGNTAIDHDGECRTLFFLLYPFFSLVSFGLLLMIVSVSVLFLVYRKRTHESI